MKNYIIAILLLGLFVTAIFTFFDKSSKSSCVRNLDKYKAALSVLLENKTLIVKNNKKPDDPNWQAQIITRRSIENLRKENPAFQAILDLWENNLISDNYGVLILGGDWNSIDFDLPGEGKFLSYLPSNKFTFPCASGHLMEHEKLEKAWYYVHYCPE